ncbi:hypothetical protein N7447_000522 [Penicillium robsamsonii]|uniref:uncharacterized protein n=1 Tax=Penicillium robsamsonii TaxID=1792511 RepID=UPI0025489F1D|nr:uncharacterized protein N7447_000522 [Penicillium robsamsonii]KAJ5834496.1 hypothetical protein N7447_000522 [Penicillium robsamsonii]
MPATKAKEARMACSPSEEATFMKQQGRLRDYCTTTLADHLKASSDIVWTSKDGQGKQPDTKEEEDRLKLVLDVEFNEETGQPTLPPSNNRLSDELVYLVTKLVPPRERGRQYPYDFDSMGNINPHRVSSGPAPIIWAHGLPFFPVYKGYYILCGREHVGCIGWLLREKTREIMQANPIWSIGAIIAPDSAVNLPHTITRQITLHKPQGIEKDARYRGKPEVRDVVAHEHHLCAVVPNPDTNEIEICQLWRAWGYNVRCGPMKDGVKPTVMPKEFFAKHGIKDINYASLDRTYANQMLEEDEESDGDIEVEDPTGTSDEGASSSNQPITTQSRSKLNVGMDIDCPAKVPAQAQEQALEQSPMQSSEQALAKDTEEVMEDITKDTPKEISKKATETVTENVTKGPMERATEETAKKLETAASNLEKKQPVAPSSIGRTVLDLGMDIGDPTKGFIDKPNPAQIRIPAISSADATIQAPAIIQPTEMKLMTMHPQIEQAVTDASAENTHITDPLNMAQIVSEQPSTEQLDYAAACGLSEDLKLAEDHASQSIADETKIDKRTVVDKCRAAEGVPT